MKIITVKEENLLTSTEREKYYSLLREYLK